MKVAFIYALNPLITIIIIIINNSQWSDIFFNNYLRSIIVYYKFDYISKKKKKNQLNETCVYNKTRKKIVTRTTRKCIKLINKMIDLEWYFKRGGVVYNDIFLRNNKKLRKVKFRNREMITIIIIHAVLEYYI